MMTDEIIELFRDEMLIIKKKGKWYSLCAEGEEITIEIDNIKNKLRIQALRR